MKKQKMCFIDQNYQKVAKIEAFEAITEADNLGFPNFQKIWVDNILMRMCTRFQLSILIFRIKPRLPKFWTPNFGSPPPSSTKT